MGFEDWDIIGQGTASLTTIAAVVKQAEGDQYVTSSLVLPFIHTCMKSLATWKYEAALVWPCKPAT